MMLCCTTKSLSCPSPIYGQSIGLDLMPSLKASLKAKEKDPLPFLILKHQQQFLEPFSQ